ncbi:HAMP domain-containing sensor histidine kinase [Rugamonas sp.]|uniref:sensor histidine kinase n=1 Tax=Rugamonas sp. TaxID=1926287 RepID=UPI0025FBD1AA|nr:HAMP domain-containing sensor histidine kinase [Rugamonas sp.]
MEDHAGSPELFLFLASTVHDMKNSISVLSGTLEQLLDARAPAAAAHAAAADADAADATHADPATAYPQLAQMLYQSKRLNDNLIQLLALYKDVGKPSYPFEPQPQLVGELIAQVASQARVLLASKGIALDTDVAPDLIWSYDEDLMIGVLVHAINNAIRYTGRRIRLSALRDGDTLQLCVEDDGPGFPPALLAAGVAAMDLPAALASSKVDFLTNSSGLGLYFASEVAKMHRHRERRGGIALSNGGALGGGVFTLRLP